MFRAKYSSHLNMFRAKFCPKHVELTEIINKSICPKYVELTGIIIVYITYISLYIFLRLAKESQFIPLQNVAYFITIHFLVRKVFTFYINDVLLLKCPFPGPKG